MMARFKLLLPFLIALRLNAQELGGRFDQSAQKITFNVYSAAATKIEVWFYDQPINQPEVHHLPLVQDTSSKIWSVNVPLSDLRSHGVRGTVYYGYRAWGPNWTFDPAW